MLNNYQTYCIRCSAQLDNLLSANDNLASSMLGHKIMNLGLLDRCMTTRIYDLKRKHIMNQSASAYTSISLHVEDYNIY